MTQDAPTQDSVENPSAPAGGIAVDNQSPVRLSRTVRFCVNASDDKDLRLPRGPEQTRSNTFAGAPAMVALGAYYEITLTCRGTPDSTTGYLVNISAIDRAVRDAAVPIVQRAFDARPQPSPVTVMHEVLEGLVRHLGGSLQALRWQLTPYHSLSMSVDAREKVSLCQSFEFAAAHRLHVDGLSDDENRAIFGKCNNPSGHGHNYRLEVSVSVPLESPPPAFNLRVLEDIVARHVIDRLDHKHLNHDAPEFARLNPSVENIARVCHARLVDPIARAGGSLRQVTVWETEKTSCTYPA